MLQCTFGCKLGSAKAKEIATTILDAWKNGETAESLKQKTPPMYAVIDLWKVGASLTPTRSLAMAKMVGPNVRFQVRFNCQDKAGKKVDKTIKYLVPQLLRSSFQRGTADRRFRAGKNIRCVVGHS